jgi:hypothetical protein
MKFVRCFGEYPPKRLKCEIKIELKIWVAIKETSFEHILTNLKAAVL